MKKPGLSLIFFFGLPALSFSASAVFRYENFGPQAAVYELIGFEWWQWEPHGDSDPTARPDIKVVVYWDEALDAIKARFPVDRNNKQDYRYLEYDKAKQHLENLIIEFDRSGLNADSLHSTLVKLTDLKKSGGTTWKRSEEHGCEREGTAGQTAGG